MEFPEELDLKLEKLNKTRYGENPQQGGAIYENVEQNDVFPITEAEKLQGGEMSFNNWLDADSVLKMLWQFEKPFATVFKHLNPAGACQNDDIFEAYKEAWDGDPMSAFGGIAGINREMTKEIAEYAIEEKFLQAIIAPGFEDEALEVLEEKEKLKVLKINTEKPEDPGFDYRHISGGFLIQEFDFREIEPEDLIFLEDKGIKKPTDDQIEDMIFGWKINRRTKSNTVLLVKDKKTVGIGAGQQNRVDSGFIAGYRANKPYEELKDMSRTCSSSEIEDLSEYIGLNTEGRSKGSVAVSSAFYPFPDTIEVLSAFGVEGSLSPAGSIRDDKAHEALKRNDMAGAHTPEIEENGYEGGIRAFLH